ncbi:MAG TPA: hypothetical protein VGL24_09355 [Chthoniobacterales bacterium]
MTCLIRLTNDRRPSTAATTITIRSKSCSRSRPSAQWVLRANGAELFLFDTRRRGEGNGGHLYGTTLPPEQKDQLLEYLKTL